MAGSAWGPRLSALATFVLLVGWPGVAGAQLPGPAVTQLSFGGFGGCVLDDGRPYCWGAVALGAGTSIAGPEPVAVVAGAIPAGVRLRQLTAGGDHACGLGSDGHAYCWGDDRYGQLGDGVATVTPRLAPVAVVAGAVPAGVTFTQLTAGGSDTCGLGSDGHAYCWGNNYEGELGDGTTTARSAPTAVVAGMVPAAVTFTQLTAGDRHTCGLGSNGYAYCWGHGHNGELTGGIGIEAWPSPLALATWALPAGVTFTQLTVGYRHTCGLGSDGHAYCWGLNVYGEWGHGTINPGDGGPAMVVAGEVPAGVTFTQLSAGYEHTCGLGSDSHTYCWGLNYAGQTGNATMSAVEPAPVAVVGGEIPTAVTLTQVSAGMLATCGLGSNGHPYCWGMNYGGYLGHGLGRSFKRAPGTGPHAVGTTHRGADRRRRPPHPGVLDRTRRHR